MPRVFHVPGKPFMDTQRTPHGAVAEVVYYSELLGQHRRMHVYTPPGYELDGGDYPVLYLLHGAGDSDDSWSTVGRAGFILDNLIGAGDAEPMIIVMPHGHQPTPTRRLTARHSTMPHCAMVSSTSGSRSAMRIFCSRRQKLQSRCSANTASTWSTTSRAAVTPG